MSEASPLMWNEDSTAFGHIYPQYVWHCEAKIIANECALRQIAAAALQAAQHGSATVQLYAHDGEGYALELERTNVTGLGYTRRPYIAEYARCDEEDYAKDLRQRIALLERLCDDAGIDVPPDA